MHRTEKAGLGAAYLAGFAGRPRPWLRRRSARWTPTARTSRSSCTASSRRCADADLVLGARWVRGGSVVNWAASARRCRSAATSTRALLGHPAERRDGRLSALPAQPRCEHIDLGDGASRWATASRSTWPAHARAGLPVAEVPITFVERVRGESKMSGPSRGGVRRITVVGPGQRRPRCADVACGGADGRPQEAS